MQAHETASAKDDMERGSSHRVFEFSAEDVLSCSSRAAGLERVHHTEVRSERAYISGLLKTITVFMSQFDRLLLSSWDWVMKEGVFRYDLTEVATRTVPGRYNIIVMVCLLYMYMYI